MKVYSSGSHGIVSKQYLQMFKVYPPFQHVGSKRMLPRLEGLTACEVYRTLTGNDPVRCPKCTEGFMLRQNMPLVPG